MTSSRDNTSFSRIEDVQSESQSLKESAKMPNQSSNTICNNNESQSKSHFQKIMGAIYDSEEQKNKTKSIDGNMNPPQKQTIPIFQILFLVFAFCSTTICFRVYFDISQQQMYLYSLQEKVIQMEGLIKLISHEQRQQDVLQEKISQMEYQTNSKLIEEMRLSQDFKQIQMETNNLQDMLKSHQERIWELESNQTMLNSKVEVLFERKSYEMEHMNQKINIGVEYLFNQTHKFDYEYSKSRIEIEILKNQFQTLKHVNEVELDELKQINRMQMNYTDSINYLTQQSQNIDLKVNSLRKDISLIEDTQSKFNEDFQNLSEQISNSTEFHGPFYSDSYLITLLFGGKDITIFHTTQPTIFKIKGRAIVTLTACGHGQSSLHEGYLTFLVNGQIQLPKSDGGMYFGVQQLSNDWAPVSLTQTFSLNMGFYEFNLGFFTQSDVEQEANLKGMSISVQITNVL